MYLETITGDIAFVNEHIYYCSHLKCAQLRCDTGQLISSNDEVMVVEHQYSEWIQKYHSCILLNFDND